MEKSKSFITCTYQQAHESQAGNDRARESHTSATHSPARNVYFFPTTFSLLKSQIQARTASAFTTPRESVRELKGQRAD